MSTPAQAQSRRAAFRRLHGAGCFVIPNPWDAGSARYLESLGFEALASSSAGLAWTLGRPDGQAPVAAALAHLRALSDSVSIPVSADFEHGYSATIDGLAANVAAAAATGICGLSIEDANGMAADPIFEVDEAVRRLRAARAALDRVDPAIMLIGRAEGYLHGRPDLAETIRRLQAYADAGADCLFAPGLRDEAEIAAVVAAVAPKPVNVVMAAAGMTKARLAAIGVRRISVGGILARAAWTGFAHAAQSLADHGAIDTLPELMPSVTLNRLFASPPPE